MREKLKMVLMLSALPVMAQAQALAVVQPVVGSGAEEAQAEAVAPQAEKAVGMVSVPVLRQAVSRGQLITADNITQQQVASAQVFASTVRSAEGLSGLEANRNLAAGQPVNRLHVDVAPTVRRNGAVTLHYVRGGIELTGKGQALEDGQVGQAVRVLNPTTRTTLMGRVSANGVVEIN